MESDEPFRLADVENRLRSDIRTTLKRNGLHVADEEWVEIIVSELVSDAMHQVDYVMEWANRE